MSAVTIHSPFSHIRNMSCLTCIHCPDLADEHGQLVSGDGSQLRKMLYTQHIKPLKTSEYATLDGKVIAQAKDKACNCPDKDKNLFNKNVRLGYFVRHYAPGEFGYRKDDEKSTHDIFRIIEVRFHFDGTMTEMSELEDLCPGYNPKREFVEHIA